MGARYLTLSLAALFVAVLSASAGARVLPDEVTMSSERGGPPIDHAQVKHKAKTFGPRSRT